MYRLYYNVFYKKNYCSAREMNGHKSCKNKMLRYSCSKYRDRDNLDNEVCSSDEKE